MFPKPNRLRVLVAESGDHRPPDTEVLVRQRLGWVMLLGAFLAILCLPSHRRMMQDQAEMVATRRAPSWLSGMPLGLRTGNSAAPAAVSILDRYPDDARLQLGGILLGVVRGPEVGVPRERAAGHYDPAAVSDPRLAYMDALQERFPDDPVVAAQALRYYSQNWIRIYRTDQWAGDGVRGLPGRDRFLTPAALTRLEVLAREGMALDPDNGYFPTVLASAFVAAGRDERALAEWERAGACRRWQDYAQEESRAARAGLIRTHGDHGLWMHLAPPAAVLLPHFAPIRGAARVFAHQAEAARARGDFAAEHRLRASLLRTGALMRREADTLIGRLVGTAVERIALGSGGGLNDDAAERAHAAYLGRVRREAPALAAFVEEEVRALPGFQRRARDGSVGEQWDRLVLPAVQREALGLTLLANAAGCLALWLGLALFALILRSGARALQGRGLPELSGTAYLAFRAGLVGIALFLALAPLALGVETGRIAGWHLAPGLVFGGVLLLSLLGRRPETPLLWNWKHAVVMGVLALGIGWMAGVGWDLTTPSPGYWKDAIPGYSLMGSYTAVGEDNALGARVLFGPAPLAIAVLLAALCLALVRRASFTRWMEAARTGARALAGTLAAGYLAYALLAVPALHRDARAADRLWEQELRAVSSPRPSR